MEKNLDSLWSEDAWDASKHIVEKIKKHQFIQKLIDGTLDENIFREYISQDIMYCDIFNSKMKKLSEKIDNDEYKKNLFEFSQSKSSILMREQYQKCFNLPPTVIKNKICEKYTFLISDQLKIIQFKKDWLQCLLVIGFILKLEIIFITINIIIRKISINLGLIIMEILIMAKKLIVIKIFVIIMLI